MRSVRRKDHRSREDELKTDRYIYIYYTLKKIIVHCTLPLGDQYLDDTRAPRKQTGDYRGERCDPMSDLDD
jgi:hypothetical protein